MCLQQVADSRLVACVLKSCPRKGLLSARPALGRSSFVTSHCPLKAMTLAACRLVPTAPRRATGARRQFDSHGSQETISLAIRQEGVQVLTASAFLNHSRHFIESGPRCFCPLFAESSVSGRRTHWPHPPSALP